MNNASDYITGDDMIALLLAEGGDEAPTYDPADKSREALIARNANIFTGTRNAVIGYYDIAIGDHDALEALGWVTLNHAARGQSYLLTDAGAAVIA